ncbi:MAG: adenosylcobalamin-dependent ribonucleoside-diphosphate reductase [Pelolinea sp.]|nr:adenosylcobalamin-dependent ribonucleoside-diphosphate reductase [Pelolinea sp.]
MPRTQAATKRKMLPTPRMPKGLQQAELTENAYQVLTRRYIRKGEKGELSETPEEMFWRVAYHIAKVEKAWGSDVQPRAVDFYKLLVSRRFFPNSPTFTGAGTPLGQLAACFVLPISDDMGRRSDGIFQTLRDAALVQQTGGGNGFAFSSLRPGGSLVNASAGKATGPIGFLRVYDHAFGEIAQGGTRRGANMAVLRVDHPDVEEFITCKTNENHITNFNISVGITDAFMHAVENDQTWDLRFPDVHHPGYRNFSGSLEEAQAAGIPIVTHKTVKARELFNLIVHQAHHNGEPGLLFLDAANRQNPMPHYYQLQATNPCGEQWLGPYENCCLGSINLSLYCAPEGKVDWVMLENDTVLATRFLDDVVDANQYVPAVPQLKEAALRARRLGLGVMGLADLMFHAGIRYGSPEGQEFAAQVMEFVRYHTMRTSVDLAAERGAFPVIKGSIYDPEALVWQAPRPLVPFERDFGRPAVDWDWITESIKKYGIRNAAQTTIAPTGTIGTVAGCEGYGCEPVFALAYIRHVNDNGKDLKLTYASPLFEQKLVESGLDEAARARVIKRVMAEGSCQAIDEIPETIRYYFVTAQDISAEEHVRMQAALQAFVDNSISKTINFPNNATEEDVAAAYMHAWKLGCKGITVYLAGSREKEVLETNSAAAAKQEEPADAPRPEIKQTTPVWLKESDALKPIFFQQTKKPRPRCLMGFTYGVETPVGKTFVTVNENGDAQPFEVFINTAKAGTDVAADSEAIARLISYILRLSSPVEPSQRMQEVWRQISDLGGGRPMGFGPNRVRSLPDGVAQVLAEYIEERSERLNMGKPPRVNQLMEGDALTPMGEAVEWTKEPEPSPMRIGDLCPECGHASLLNVEGCRKCYSCGYSEC